MVSIGNALPLEFNSLQPIEDTPNTYWLQTWRYSEWSHPEYGDVKVNEELGNDFVEHFLANTFGQELPFTYEHGKDSSKGLQASGWVRDIETRDDGCYYKIEFTDDAIADIKAKKYRYISPEFFSSWTNNETNEEFKNVPVGGTLTNRPFFKGQIPLNFSEIDYTDMEVDEELADAILTFADWSTAYKNNLPDSAFLYIEPGGKKDKDGKTVPRSLRHFPVRDSNGKVDRIHAQKVIQLAPKSGVSDSIKSRVVAAAKRLLGSSKKMSEEGSMGDEETPTLSEESVRQFFTSLGIESPEKFTDEFFVSQAESLNGILKPLQNAQTEADKQKSFREMFPDEYERMHKLEEAQIKNDAREFSEQYERFVIKKDGKEEPDTRGFSTLVLEKIETVHMKFSEGSATTDDLRDLLDHIGSGGIVDYKEYGSSRTPDRTFAEVDLHDVRDVRKRFSDLVQEIMVNDELEYGAAIQEAAKREPELAQAYGEVR